MRTKKTLLLLSLFGILILLATGCKKDDDGNPIVASMTAKVDGNQWQAAPLQRAAILSNNKLTITGKSLTGEIIILYLSGTTTGKYVLGPMEENKSYASYKPDASVNLDAYISVTGEVEVTEINENHKIVSGTFHFEALKPTDLSTVSIAEGKFEDVSYTGSSE